MNSQQQRESLSGVVAVPTTPSARRGIDEAGYQRVIRRLIEGAFVLSPEWQHREFYALAPAERGSSPVLAWRPPTRHNGPGRVGHDVASAREAARDAQAAGAAMIMVHQPVHPYVSVDGWIEYHRAIASDVPELGVVLYVRNDAIPLGLCPARRVLPQRDRVKYAVPNPARFATVAAKPVRAVHLGGRSGRAPCPGYFAVGATGFTSGLANIDPSTSLRLWHAWPIASTTS